MYPALWASVALLTAATVMIVALNLIAGRYARRAEGLLDGLRSEAAEKQRQVGKADVAMAKSLASDPADQLPGLIRRWQRMRADVLNRVGESPWNYGAEAFAEWVDEQARIRSLALAAAYHRRKVLTFSLTLAGGLIAAAAVYATLSAQYHNPTL